MKQVTSLKQSAKLSNNTMKHKTVEDINTVVNGCCCDKAKMASKMRYKPSKSCSK